jgi:hypothetical protein
VFAGGALVRDSFLGIALEQAGLLGVGHELVLERDPDFPHVFPLAVHLEGGGFITREQQRLPPGTDAGAAISTGTNTSVGPRIAGYYRRLLDRSTVVGLESELLLDALELQDFIVTTTGFVSVRLWGPLAARLFLTHRYDGKPAPGVASKSDFYSAVAFSVRFEAESSPGLSRHEPPRASDPSDVAE